MILRSPDPYTDAMGRARLTTMMHQSEFDAANVALSRAADKRKSLINIHKNRYTATRTVHNVVELVRAFHYSVFAIA